MKKLLIILKPLPIAITSLLIVTGFLRYYLYLNSQQLVREFKNQNYREIYSLDTMKISSRLNSLSSVINWVCIEGKISNEIFYKIKQGECRTSLLQQNQKIYLPQANRLEINFTNRLPKEVEYLFIIFLIFQSVLIFALIISTKIAEKEKHFNEIKYNKLARQMSHDIRSPLATLNTILEDSSFNFPDNIKVMILNSLNRINDISNKHLLSSKSQDLISYPPKLNEINIGDKLIRVIDLKKIEFKKIIIKFINTEDTKKCFSTIDDIEFERIISNIINNSVEALATELVIRLELVNQELRIIIKDNGKGIPVSILHALGSKEITTKSTGNGLGIIHAKESIESWGGTLSIESQINNFTEIVLTLPIIFNLHYISTSASSILLDDDDLVRMTWEFKARKADVNLITFSKYEDFKASLNYISKESNIYLDSELGESIKGEDIALELYNLGFSNIFITSGNPTSYFKNISFVKGIRDKTPPW